MRKILMLMIITVVMSACNGSDIQPVTIDSFEKFNKPLVWKNIVTEFKTKEILTIGKENVFDYSGPPVTTTGTVTLEYAGGSPKYTTGLPLDSVDSLLTTLEPLMQDFRLTLGKIRASGGSVFIYPGEYRNFKGYRSILFGLINDEISDLEAPLEYTIYFEKDELIILPYSYVIDENVPNKLGVNSFKEMFQNENFALYFRPSDEGGNAALLLLDFPESLFISPLKAVPEEHKDKSIAELREIYPYHKIFYEEGSIPNHYFMRGITGDESEVEPFFLWRAVH